MKSPASPGNLTEILLFFSMMLGKVIFWRDGAVEKARMARERRARGRRREAMVGWCCCLVESGSPRLFTWFEFEVRWNKVYPRYKFCKISRHLRQLSTVGSRTPSQMQETT